MINLLKPVFLSLLLALQLSAVDSSAQTRIKISLTATGDTLLEKESLPGSNNFDKKVIGKLPADAQPLRIGSQVLNPYKPEPKGQFTPEQFGPGKYYSNTFKFNVDIWGYKTPDERKLYGVNQFTRWAVRDADQASLKKGDGFHFMTQNFLGDQAFAHNFCMSGSLQEFVTKNYNSLPALGQPGDWEKYTWANFNIESPLALDPGNYNAPLTQWGFSSGHYGTYNNPDWNQVKNNLIKLETSGETITLEQLASRGYDAWYLEYNVRFANRMTVLGEMLKEKSAPGIKFTSGITAYTAYPNRARKNGTDFFMNSDCNVNFIGGSGGVITLQLPTGKAWTVSMTGLPQAHEDFASLTPGLGEAEFEDGEYSKIFIQKLPETQSVPYAWAHTKPWGVVAQEKGMIQHILQRYQARLGRTLPIYREQNMHYETNLYELPWLPDMGGGRTRLFFPPYIQYARYAIPRFFAGNEEGWGYHLFPQNPNHCVKDPATDADPVFRNYYNFALHAWTAPFQARADMQFLESWYTGSTLVQNPDVQVGATGSFQSYDGIDAFDTYPNPQLPAYILRHKPIIRNGATIATRVVILGGLQQGWFTEHTDVVRLPNNGLNGAKFKMKLIGPGVHIYDFTVPIGESNQTYEALPSIPTSFMRPGYSGKIINN